MPQRESAAAGEQPARGDSFASSRSNLPGVAAIAAGLAFGLVAAQSSIPRLFAVLPNDLARNRTVLSAMATGRPQVVIFGDSRAEAAVDARHLSQLLPGKPLAYNLATHSQTIAQAFLFQQQLPPSVHTIVQFVTPENLGSRVALDSNVFNAMYLYGYRPSRTRIESLRRCFGPDLQSVAASDARQRFDGRWVVRQALDTTIRSLTRRDLALEREKGDLYFPTAYTRRLSIAPSVDAVPSPRQAAVVADEQRCLLQEIASRAGAKRLLFVIPPVRRKDHREAAIVSMMGTLRSTGARVIDLSSALSDSEFADELHVTPEGAQRITAVIGAALGERH